MKKWCAMLLLLVLVSSSLFPALAESADTTQPESVETVETVDAKEDTATADEVVTETEKAPADETETDAEEPAEEAAKPSWFTTAFGKMGKQHWYTWAIILCLLIAGFAIIMTRRGNWSRGWAIVTFLVFAAAAVLVFVNLFTGGIYDEIRPTSVYIIAILALLAAMILLIVLPGGEAWDARRVAYAGICMSIAFVLSMIKLYRAPQGGSVTPAAALPLILFCLAFGPRQGLVVCFAYGLFQLIEDPYVIHPIQLLVDYPMAYGAIALSTLARRIKDVRARMICAVLFGYLGRYIMAVLSGVIFFAEYAGEQNALLYSLGYNIAYMGPETVLAMLIAAIPGMGRLLGMMNKNMKRA